MSRFSRTAGALSIFLFALHQPAVAQQKLYWTDQSGLHRANLDGSDAVPVIANRSYAPVALALAAGSGKMYWSNGRSSIRRSNLDGSEIEVLISSSSIEAIALDLTNSRLYWAENGFQPSQKRILSATLDGDDITPVIGSGLTDPTALALDLVEGRMYCADGNTIKRAELNGVNVQDLFPAGAGNPTSLALDSANRYIYWTDRTAGVIRRADMDGGKIEDIVEEYTAGAVGITLDSADGKLYWSDFSGHIGHANLDGTQAGILVRGNLRSPRSVALELGTSSLYWTDPTAGRLERFHLKTARRVQVLASTRLDGLFALDLQNGFAYWVIPGNGSSGAPAVLQRAGLDGTDVEDMLITSWMPMDLVLDRRTKSFYWPAQLVWDVCCFGKLQRLTLEPLEVVDLTEEISTGMTSITLDSASQKLYWTDWYAIYRANTDGSGSEPFRSLQFPFALAFDSSSSRVYWSNFDRIYSADVDAAQTQLYAIHQDVIDLAIDHKSAFAYWIADDQLFRAPLHDGTAIEPIGLTMLNSHQIQLDLRKPADFDETESIDLADFAWFQNCYTGDASFAASSTCYFFDDQFTNSRIDLNDFGAFLSAWTSVP